MKRAAAIIGPTASFVRWAIIHQCQFRQPVEREPAYQVFRQLRSLREVSLARHENRIVDNICIHGEFNQSSETARGFPVDEIEAIYGDLNLAEQICGNCPANAWETKNGQTVLAGCYGWFFSENEDTNLVQLFETVNDSDSAVFESFPATRRSWFRIWQNSNWHGVQLERLEAVFDPLPSSVVEDHLDLSNFCRAIKRCKENNLLLVTELVPSGNSDGIHWSVEPHCSNCRCEMYQDRRCDECGQVSHAVPKRKRRVLGLRPYMLLKGLLGTEKTLQLLQQFNFP